MVVRMRRESTLSTCLGCLDSEIYTFQVIKNTDDIGQSKPRRRTPRAGRELECPVTLAL